MSARDKIRVVMNFCRLKNSGKSIPKGRPGYLKKKKLGTVNALQNEMEHVLQVLQWNRTTTNTPYGVAVHKLMGVLLGPSAIMQNMRGII